MIYRKYQSQFIFLISVTTLAKWREIERGTSSPQKRIKMLRMLKQRNIQVALFINPFMEGITDAEFENIIDLAQKAGSEDVIVSPLYVNDLILEKLSKNKSFEKIIERYNLDNIGKHHLKEKKLNYEVVESNIHNPLETVLKNQIPDIRFWKHYSCFLAYTLKRRSYHYGDGIICDYCGQCKTQI